MAQPWVKKWIFFLSLLVFTQVYAREEKGQEKSESAFEDLPVLTYDYTLKGADDTDIPKEFKSRSRLELLKKRPLYSNFALSRRVQSDKDILQKLFYSFGYYDANIDILISDSLKQDVSRHVEFTVIPGKRYKLKSLQFVFTPKAEGPEPCQKSPSDLKLYTGEFFTAEKVLSAFNDVKEHLGTCGYPFATIITHEAVLSRSDKTVKLVLTLDPGLYVTFGPIQVKSSGAVSTDYIKNRAPFKQGEPYDQGQIDEYQDALSTSKLFEKIIIQHRKEKIQKNHELPVEVDLSDGKPRTLSAGVKFGTSEGIGAKTGWTHRNLTGHADKFVAGAEASQTLSMVDLNYYLPDFLKRNQTLGTTVNYKEENTKSYDSRGYGTSFLLDNEFKKGWNYSYGFSFESTRISQRGEIIHFDALGVPLGFTLDTRNDALDPSSRGKLSLSITPEYGHLGHAKFITHSQLYGSYHWAMDDRHRHVLALWSRIGSVFGGSLKDIPGNRRLYAGGGGSVKGYGYQLAGTLDGEGKPLGGKSLLEFGIEPRVRFGDDWGVVVFLEGALVSKTTQPNFANSFLFGVGGGLRYYTSFGPIRADIAVPLKKRRQDGGKIVDRAFQFYISIGQSF